MEEYHLLQGEKTITVVSAIPSVGGGRFGEPVDTLMRVAAGGVRTVPSVIVPKGLFELFSNSDGQVDNKFTGLLDATLDTVKRELGPCVDIRASFEVSPPGFPEHLQIRNSRKSVGQGILTLFSAWYDDKFHAFRIVHKLAPPSTFPTLWIQNHVRTEMSLVSREPLSGSRITEADIRTNVNIDIPLYRPVYARLIDTVERLAGFPVRFIFTKTPKLQVCRVEKDEITVAGWLQALSSMKSEGVLDVSRCLCLIEPEMIACYSGYRIVVEPKEFIASGAGLGASSGCATGVILLRRDGLPTDELPRIFVCVEGTPEDIDHVAACAGGLGARGGMTSHFAVALRGMGKPGVVAASDLSVSRKGVRVGTTVVPSGAHVYVDGNTGRFAFSHKPFRVDSNYCASTDVALLSALLSDIHTLTRDRKNFSSLPVEDQLHVAALLGAFRKIGVEP